MKQKFHDMSSEGESECAQGDKKKSISRATQSHTNGAKKPCSKNSAGQPWNEWTATADDVTMMISFDQISSVLATLKFELFLAVAQDLMTC